MSEEIREVLEYYKKDTKDKLEWLKSINFQYGDKRYIQRVKNHELLLNYITNLQNENESLKRKLDCKERLTKIFPEDTEFIILTKSDYEKQESEIELMAIDYKQRNEKAIEYIENHSRFEPPYYEIREFNNKANLTELYHILKGVDEE